ncbi:MAG: OTU domain-containing protein [Gammaproteobacteria bacterium]
MQRLKEEKSTFLTNFSSLSSDVARQIFTYLPGRGKDSVTFFSRVNKKAAQLINPPNSTVWKQLIVNELFIPIESIKEDKETYKAAYYRHVTAIRKLNEQIDWSELYKLKATLATHPPIYKTAVTIKAITRYLTKQMFSKEINTILKNLHSIMGPDLFDTFLKSPSAFVNLFETTFNRDLFTEYLQTMLKPHERQQLMTKILNDRRYAEAIFRDIIPEEFRLGELIHRTFTEEEKNAVFEMIIHRPALLSNCEASNPGKILPALFDLIKTKKQESQLRHALKNDYFARLFISTPATLKMICEKFPEAQNDFFARLFADGKWLMRLTNKPYSLKPFLAYFPQYKEALYQAIIKHWNEVNHYKILSEIAEIYPEKKTALLELLKEPQKIIPKDHTEIKSWLAVLEEIGFKIEPYQRQAIIDHHLNESQSDPERMRIVVLSLVTVFKNPKELAAIRNAILNENLLHLRVFLARPTLCALYGDDSYPLEHKQIITQFILKHKAFLFRFVEDLINFLYHLRNRTTSIGMSQTDFINTLLQDQETYTRLFGNAFADNHCQFINQYPEHMTSLINITFTDPNRYKNPEFIANLGHLLRMYIKPTDNVPPLDQLISQKLFADELFWTSLFTLSKHPLNDLQFLLNCFGEQSRKEADKLIPQAVKNRMIIEPAIDTTQAQTLSRKVLGIIEAAIDATQEQALSRPEAYKTIHNLSGRGFG